MPRKPILLIAIDGFGISAIDENNPVVMAKKPNMDEIMAHYPYGILDASGIAVGLPWGEVGNSEVGHLNLGAGLVVYQNLPRINISIENKSFFSNDVFLKAVTHVQKNKSKLHFYGITSTGGVHGHIDHLKALIQFAQQKKIKDAYIHCITDGRDSPAQGSLVFLKDLQETMKKSKTGMIASLCGRYWAMDRNNAWDRTQRAYDVLTLGKGNKNRDVFDALKKSYVAKQDDEMLEPVIITDKKDNPLALIGDNDAVIFFNFREDRARQIAKGFVEKDFKNFPKEKVPQNLFFATFTEYEAGLETEVAFPPQHIAHPFGSLVSEAGLKQLRIAETEKYAHVTYFFNGGAEETYKDEDRVLVESPKVKTYDMKPEMSAYGVTEKLIPLIEKKIYDFILVNYANPDMVGHTGNLSATVKGVEAVDECIGKIVEVNRKIGGITAITADHGNAEIKVDILKHTISKEHSTSPVPFMLIREDMKKNRTPEEIEVLKKNINPIGILADVAPTLLELMELKPSPDMTGRSLLNDLL
ncbi:2,3-bisphosphoglycerate-independent phosphoglycerate mutase [Candidatus Uhrbacteria bacterium]|nr:2,3-bisphosphoglycerate-independent phosphoglycerate mutase [Candidatus Uhrbacteria bacterium]